MPKTQKLKVVIAAGGDGTRLGSLNPERKPKSLLLFNNRPLISYHLDQIISQLKPDRILLSFTSQKQIEGFQWYLGEGLIPCYDYLFNIHSHFDHPHILFRNKSVIRFIKSTDYVFTLGDLFITGDIYKRIRHNWISKGTSIVTRETARDKG